MTTKKTVNFNFDAALKELESIVNTIERGGLTLEESLKLFADGITLTKKCQQAIKTAEQKVKILTGEDLVDFKLDDDEEEEEIEADEEEE